MLLRSPIDPRFLFLNIVRWSKLFIIYMNVCDYSNYNNYESENNKNDNNNYNLT